MHKKADYLVTGEWATKAHKEAKQFGRAVAAASSADANFNYIPKNVKWSDDADYVHITTNNTIYGTRITDIPNVGKLRYVADMSSDFLSREMNYSQFDLIYAGAQKTSALGATMVVIKKNGSKLQARTSPRCSNTKHT